MNFRWEKQKIKQGFATIIGCDEVGRGCLAGPVVAAAVALDLSCKMEDLREVRDSKLLAPHKRKELSTIIKQSALAWSIAEVSSEEVDEINIHNASLLAMNKAISILLGNNLHEIGDSEIFAVIDGKFKVPNLDIQQEAIIGGDNKILSIAAASIIAKVYRDQLMQEFDKKYPKYNLAKHKGYATEHHRKMILEHGLSPLHRLSFCQNLSV